MKVPASVIRFLLEAGFIILIAAAAALAHLDNVWIALSVGGAWLLVSIVERSSIQKNSFLRSGRLGALFAGRKPQEVASEPGDEVSAQVAETAEEHPPMPAPEPEPPPAPEPAPPAPEPQPPTPEPGEPPPELRVVAAPDPEPEAQAVQEPEPAPEPVVRLPLDGAPPREWNVWELERLAKEAEGRDSARDQELAFLLLELRQFANADGQLPIGFDPVVRESFGELLYSAV
jgi:outer membrane biosynthesis protein TonB